MDIFRNIIFCGRTQGQRADASNRASGSSTKPNTIELSFLVSYARAVGHPFLLFLKELSAKSIKHFPHLAGGIKGGGENNNKLWSDYFATLTQPLPSRERSMHLGLPLLRMLYTMLIMFLICTNSVFASVNFISSEIDTGENRQGYWAADMNGDSLKDIIIATWSKANGREFLIYTQEASGKFSGSPWRRIEIKKDIIAFGLADLRPDPGNEFIFFTGSACYSLSCAREGYANNLKKLFEWELIKSVPDKKKIDFIGDLKDLNDDNFVDMLLPGQKQYALFRGQPNEKFSKVSILPEANVIINKSRQSQQSFSITPAGVVAGGPDIYEGLVVQRLESKPVGKIFYPPILSYNHWIPGILTGRFNPDDLDDFVYLDDIETEKKNTRRLNLIYQSENGEMPENPDWQAEITVYDDIKLMDLNGDKLIDLVTSKNKGLNTTLYIFLNHGGRFNFEKPDHVMKLKGMMSDLQVMDFNRDRLPELVISTYSASPLKAVASGSVERRFLIFAGKKHDEDGPLFARNPAFSYQENFTSSDFKSLTGERSFTEDIDGDGINDVVSIDKNGALTANRIKPDLKLETEPFLTFTPRHFILGNRLVKLNQDDRTDIIVEHEHGLSLIISQQGVQ